MYTYLNITGDTALPIYIKAIFSTIGNSSSPVTTETLEFSNSTKRSILRSMSLCNIHASDDVIIDLYVYYTEVNQSNDPSRGQYNEDNTLDVIADTYQTYYILKSVTIPKGVTLYLSEDELNYESLHHDLYIKLNASDSAVDITIKE